MKDFRHICFIILLTTVGFVATDVYLPSMPAITSYFGTTNTLVQFTMPAYLLTFGIAPLIFGPISDIIGRRKVIIMGLIIGNIASILAIYAPNIYALIVLRIFQGIGLGAVTITARTMIPDLYRGHEMAKFHSLTNTFVPIVIALSPLIGGWLQERYEWQYVFIYLTGYISFLIIITVPFLPETNTNLHEGHWKELFKSYRDFLSIKGFFCYALIMSLIMSGGIAYLTLSPYYFQNILGLDAFEYGLTAVAVCFAIMLGAAINTRLLNHFTPRTLLRLSSYFVALSSLGMFYFSYTENLTIWTVLPCCMIYFLSLNFVFPNAYVMAFNYISRNFGLAAALIMSCQMIFSITTGSLISILPDDSIMPLAYLFLFISVLIIVFLKLAAKHDQPLLSKA